MRSRHARRAKRRRRTRDPWPGPPACRRHDPRRLVAERRVGRVRATDGDAEGRATDPLGGELATRREGRLVRPHLVELRRQGEPGVGGRDEVIRQRNRELGRQRVGRGPALRWHRLARHVAVTRQGVADRGDPERVALVAKVGAQVRQREGEAHRLAGKLGVEVGAEVDGEGTAVDLAEAIEDPLDAHANREAVGEVLGDRRGGIGLRDAVELAGAVRLLRGVHRLVGETEVPQREAEGAGATAVWSGHAAPGQLGVPDVVELRALDPGALDQREGSRIGVQCTNVIRQRHVAAAECHAACVRPHEEELGGGGAVAGVVALGRTGGGLPRQQRGGDHQQGEGSNACDGMPDHLVSSPMVWWPA